MDDRLLTAKEAARKLHISPRKLWDMVAANEVPHIRIGTRSVRFSPAALDQWIAEQMEGGS